MNLPETDIADMLLHSDEEEYSEETKESGSGHHNHENVDLSIAGKRYRYAHYAGSQQGIRRMNLIFPFITLSFLNAVNLFEDLFSSSTHLSKQQTALIFYVYLNIVTISLTLQMASLLWKDDTTPIDIIFADSLSFLTIR
jgi:hypothetical protein